MDDYSTLLDILKNNDGETTLKERTQLATRAFRTSSHYDTMINKYLEGTLEDVNPLDSLNLSEPTVKSLRYGENPHQEGRFFGNSR